MAVSKRPNVVIIGSGFGGLFAAQSLKDADVLVTLISKTGHHLFQPLLYQVATGILSEGEIAPTTREILRRQPNARVVQGLVTGIDMTNRQVISRFHGQESTFDYDTLIVAAGAGQSYFGNDHFATFAPGMKSIDDALELRSRIFSAFEVAETEEDPEALTRLLTFVVVGAGPTGVEMAGQIRELSSNTLTGDFRRIDPSMARVILMDAAPQVLPAFGKKLGDKTRRALEDLGVEVKLGAMVTDVDAAGLVHKLEDGTSERIECACKVWAAGVQGSELGRVITDQCDAELDRSGRVKVEADLTVKGHPEVFVIGDLAFREGVPGMAPAAIQGAQYVAGLIQARIEGTDGEIGPFRYVDKGSMATISKYQAVASIRRLRITGFPAWVAWLVVHLMQMVGFKNRVTTLLHWGITFVGNDRSQRVTTNQQMVGRLAMERLGQGASADLITGRPIQTGSLPPRTEG